MTTQIVYTIEDRYANPRAKYGEIIVADELAYNPKVLKFIDTCKPYYHKYYFSTSEKRSKFLGELFDKRLGEDKIMSWEPPLEEDKCQYIKDK